MNNSAASFPQPDAGFSTAGAAIRMENITKRFPGVTANEDVHLHVATGSFHALIGENGAGKSTLLNILYGRYRPDTGRTWVGDQEVTAGLRSPADAIRLGIGLISQHYALIPALTVLENIVVGVEPIRPGGILAYRTAAERIEVLARQLGLSELDLKARAGTLSIGAQQKVEILKALYRGARILLLDEPTATLAPPEADALFALLHALVAQGTTLVFVTHKLREVMAHSDAVTILRAGRNVGDYLTRETDEQQLLLRMVGPIWREEGRTKREMWEGAALPAPAEIRTGMQASGEYSTPPTVPCLQVEGVTVHDSRGATAVRDVSLTVGVGEIVGVAGVDGSGQRELAEAIVGLRRVETGRLFLKGTELTQRSVRRRQELGVAYIPEDRHGAGLILDFSIAENYLLGHEGQQDWGGGLTLDPQTVRVQADSMLQRYHVQASTAGARAPARTLSGGNQQKVVIARALDGRPHLLVAVQPTRGLDVEATRFVYRSIHEARQAGLGVLLFSLDLDEILEMSDRIVVMFNGGIAGVVAQAQATVETLGALMTGAKGSEESREKREQGIGNNINTEEA